MHSSLYVIYFWITGGQNEGIEIQRKATLKLEKLMNWSVQKCWKTRALHEVKTRGAPCTTSNEYRSTWISEHLFLCHHWNNISRLKWFSSRPFRLSSKRPSICQLCSENPKSNKCPLSFHVFFFQLENPNSKEKNQKHTDTKTLCFRVFVDWIAGAPSRDDQSDGSTEIGEQERFEAIKERVENKAPYAKCAWYSDYNIPVFSVSHILVICISHLSLTPFSAFGLACMLLSRKTKNCHTGPKLRALLVALRGSSFGRGASSLQRFHSSVPRWNKPEGNVPMMKRFLKLQNCRVKLWKNWGKSMEIVWILQTTCTIIQAVLILFPTENGERSR